MCFFIVFLGIFSIVNPQSLSSDLPEDPVCPGVIVTFTCETRGSSALAWASDEYIASDGSRLEFATFNSIGDRRTSPVNLNTVATLVNKTDGILVSELHIKALSQFLNSSVACIVGSKRNTTLVQVLGMCMISIYSHTVSGMHYCNMLTTSYFLTENTPK